MTSAHIKLDKAVRAIGERGLDGLIVYSNGSCDILAPKYLHYFAEFRPMGRNNAALVAKDGRTALVVEPQWDVLRVKQKSWIGDVRGSADFSDDLKAAMGEFGLTERVGIAGYADLNDAAYRAMNIRAEIEPADRIITDMAGEKTEKERNFARQAGRAADAGFRVLLDFAGTGCREYELLAEMERAMRPGRSRRYL